jgi:hypothetical protein
MNRIENTIRRTADRRRWLFGCMLAAAALMCAVPVSAAEDSAQTNLEQWLLRRLNQPTEHERKHEREGNVYIYDGLTDREVEQALSRNFGRIEYMMFVGTRKTVPNDTSNANAQNNAETESPGCL